MNHGREWFIYLNFCRKKIILKRRKLEVLIFLKKGYFGHYNKTVLLCSLEINGQHERTEWCTIGHVDYFFPIAQCFNKGLRFFVHVSEVPHWSSSSGLDTLSERQQFPWLNLPHGTRKRARPQNQNQNQDSCNFFTEKKNRLFKFKLSKLFWQ